MKKKGFTLIELLAVIVVLAIIALIATPAVLNIIEDSRKNSAEVSALNIVRSAKNYYAASSMKGIKLTSIDVLDTNLKYDGKKPDQGYITYNNQGKTSAKMYLSEYCIVVSENNNVSSTKTSITKCFEDVKDTLSIGDEVYYDVMRETLNCTNYHVDNSVTGFNGIIDSSYLSYTKTTDNQTSCLKFYLVNELDNKMILILDHNTTDRVAWIDESTYDIDNNSECSNSACHDEGPLTALGKLELDTMDWKGTLTPTSHNDQIYGKLEYIGYKARFLTLNEVTELTGDYTGNLDNNCTWETVCGEGKNRLGWLIDYTNGCKEFGCNYEISSTNEEEGVNGYWLADSYIEQENKAWYINRYSSYGPAIVYGVGLSGIRPVIELEKKL